MDYYRLARYMRLWLTNETKAALVSHMKLMASDQRARRGLLHLRRNLDQVKGNELRKQARNQRRTVTRGSEKRQRSMILLWRQRTTRLALERRFQRQVELHCRLRSEARHLLRWRSWRRSKRVSYASHRQSLEALIGVSFWRWREWHHRVLFREERRQDAWNQQLERDLQRFFSRWQLQVAELLEQFDCAATALMWWQNLKKHNAWVRWSRDTDSHLTSYDKFRWGVAHFHRNSLRRHFHLWRSAVALHFDCIEWADAGRRSILGVCTLHAWRKWRSLVRCTMLAGHLLTEAECHHVKRVWRQWQALYMLRERRVNAAWEAIGNKRLHNLPYLEPIRDPTFPWQAP